MLETTKSRYIYLPKLRKAIEEKCLSPENKFGMLDDAYALCEAGEVSIMPLLSLMDLYREEVSMVDNMKLGLEAVSGESHLPTMVREEVFMALVNLDHKETHEELKKRFQTCFLSIEEVLAPAEDGAAATVSTGDAVKDADAAA
ncbi:aminopeptidase M1-like protein isoform X1 [Tanacetum coccineum]